MRFANFVILLLLLSQVVAAMEITQQNGRCLVKTVKESGLFVQTISCGDVKPNLTVVEKAAEYDKLIKLLNELNSYYAQQISSLVNPPPPSFVGGGGGGWETFTFTFKDEQNITGIVANETQQPSVALQDDDEPVWKWILVLFSIFMVVVVVVGFFILVSQIVGAISKLGKKVGK